MAFRTVAFDDAQLLTMTHQPKSGSWRFEIGVEVACGMVDGIKSLV